MPIRCCFFILIIANLLFLPVAHSCELKVRTFAFPPLGMKSATGQWQGLDMDYTKALLELAGCRYSFVDIPWARAVRLLKLGRVDLMLNVSKTKEREHTLHFVGPQRDEVMRFVSRKGKFPVISQWHQMETLEGTLMRQRGTYIGERLDRVLNKNLVLKNRMVTLAYTDVKIELLAMGRADGFFAESSYLYHQLKTNKAFSIVEVHPLVIHRSAVYYAFSKASMSEADMKKINSAYQQLAKSGKLDKIAQRYSKY